MADNDVPKRYIFTEDAKKGYGIGGISGDRFTDVAGWEHGTVGFAGNIYSRLASENGIQPVDPNITASREPFRVGRFLLKMLKTVPFFDDKVTAAWRYIIEDTATEFNGIQSYGFEVFTKTHGVTRQNSAYTGIFKENNGEFTIKVPETAGQLVRKASDYWFYGMSDPKTGVAHFYGKDVRDLQPNKSMSILYVLLGPTCRPEDIEYAAIYHDCVLTTPKHDHNNAGTLGEAGSGVEHDLTFSGTFDRGPEVDRLAAIVVDREGLYEERSQNALLPAYIYNHYMTGSAFTNEYNNYSALLSDRMINELKDSFGGQAHMGSAQIKNPINDSAVNAGTYAQQPEWNSTKVFTVEDKQTTGARNGLNVSGSAISKEVSTKGHTFKDNSEGHIMGTTGIAKTESEAKSQSGAENTVNSGDKENQAITTSDSTTTATTTTESAGTTT